MRIRFENIWYSVFFVNWELAALCGRVDKITGRLVIVDLQCNFNAYWLAYGTKKQSCICICRMNWVTSWVAFWCILISRLPELPRYSLLHTLYQYRQEQDKQVVKANTCLSVQRRMNRCRPQQNGLVQVGTECICTRVSVILMWGGTESKCSLKKFKSQKFVTIFYWLHLAVFLKSVWPKLVVCSWFMLGLAAMFILVNVRLLCGTNFVTSFACPSFPVIWHWWSAVHCNEGNYTKCQVIVHCSHHRHLYSAVHLVQSYV